MTTYETCRLLHVSKKPQRAWRLITLAAIALLSLPSALKGQTTDQKPSVGEATINETLISGLIEAWGPCSGACPFDLNHDGMVNSHDLTLLVISEPVVLQNIGMESPIVDGMVKPPGIPAPRTVPRSAERPDLFGAANRIVMPPLDVPQLVLEDDLEEGLGPLRMGVVQEFPAQTTDRSGLWAELDDGGWLWTMSFRATGARAVRLRVSPWNPPAGAELIVYAPGDPAAVRGPFRARLQPNANRLWTPTIYAEEVRLEYFLPPAVPRPAAGAHIGVDALLNQYRPLHGDRGGPLPCHRDVSCFSAWQTAADAVGALSYVTNQFGFFCSGAMIGRVGGDMTPLFTTAVHCGVDAGNADSALVTWFYQTDSCNGNPPNLNSLPQTPGVALLVNDAPDDYTLLGLSTQDTSGVTFAGWNAGTWNTDSSSTGIHHPRGSFKRITLGSYLQSADNCVPDATNPAYRTFNPDGLGELEPGSSGSPVFDNNQHIRGVLSCANWGCNENNTGVYGRLALAYALIWPYLDPRSSVYLDAGYVGDEFGTVNAPFNSLVEGYFAVREDGELVIEGGTYEGGFVMDKAMTLTGQGGIVHIE
ncbi:MAG: trypsin-like serine peptidase [Planctomycetota bacterium]|jgi:hypothetical protein